MTVTFETETSPEGIVIRRKWATGEDIWRQTASGEWHHYPTRNGPWGTINSIYVPREVLAVVANARELDRVAS